MNIISELFFYKKNNYVLDAFNKGAKIAIVDDIKIKRTKKFNRNITFVVVIGEYSYKKCDKIYSKFISILDDGIYVEDNYVEMTIDSDVDWVEEKDSIISSEIAVQILITFNGGVYKDTGYKKVDINISLEDINDVRTNKGS